MVSLDSPLVFVLEIMIEENMYIDEKFIAVLLLFCVVLQTGIIVRTFTVPERTVRERWITTLLIWVLTIPALWSTIARYNLDKKFVTTESAVYHQDGQNFVIVNGYAKNVGDEYSNKDSIKLKYPTPTKSCGILFKFHTWEVVE